MSDRPRVGISSCLLGEAVRHDGGHKRNSFLVDILGREVEWVAVCPEVEIGMGTPREPIHLTASDQGVRAGDACVRLIAVSTGEDWTQRMDAWAHKRASDLASMNLSGYVLKADSPSCGPKDVGVHHLESITVTADGRGLFAQAIVDTMPDLPVEDERRLSDPDVRDRFIALVFARHRVSMGPHHA